MSEASEGQNSFLDQFRPLDDAKTVVANDDMTEDGARETPQDATGGETYATEELPTLEQDGLSIPAAVVTPEANTPDKSDDSGSSEIDSGVLEGVQTDTVVESTEPQGVFCQTADRARRAGVSLGRGAMLGAAAVTYGFEQSPANESLRGKWGIKALVKAHEWAEGLDSRWATVAMAVGAAAVVVGGITMAVETISGGITAATIRKKNGMLGWFNRKIISVAGKLSTVDGKGRPAEDAALGLAGGASLLVAKRHAEAEEAGEERTIGQDARTVVKASAGISAFSAAVAGLAVGAIETADIHDRADAALYFSDAVSSARFWWGVYGATVVLPKIVDYAGQRGGAWYNSRQSVIDRALAKVPTIAPEPNLAGVEAAV